MNYSPKHDDTKIRAIYGALIVLGLAFTVIGTGLVKTVFTALSLVFIATGLYLFIRHDLTSYTYIVMENEGKNIVIASHNGVIRVLIGFCKNYTAATYRQAITSVSNCSVTEIIYDGGVYTVVS